MIKHGDMLNLTLQVHNTTSAPSSALRVYALYDTYAISILIKVIGVSLAKAQSDNISQFSISNHVESCFSYKRW